MRPWRSLAIAALVITLGACAHTPASTKPLQTVPHVDLGRYVGTWYEIASYPQWFQKGCTATSATYAKRDDGLISVTNRCRKISPDGKESIANGRARIVDPATNAKLEVSFFWPFWGDYWIIDLGDAYDYAVVGHPSRKYLWILSRTRSMDAAKYEAILQRLRMQGYDTDKLEKTVQPQ